MTRRAANWQLVGAVTVAACLGAAALGRAQFTSFNDRSRAMLEGHWQSCREADGQYGERVYDGTRPVERPIDTQYNRTRQSHLTPSEAFRRPVAKCGKMAISGPFFVESVFKVGYTQSQLLARQKPSIYSAS